MIGGGPRAGTAAGFSLRPLVSRILFPDKVGMRSFLWDSDCSKPQATYPRIDPSFDGNAPGPALSAYLVLLPVGFALPLVSPRMRCALTAPFHPYLRKCRMMNAECGMRNSLHHSSFFILHFPGRYLFCGTFRSRLLGTSPLATTVPCAVRTFLTPGPFHKLRARGATTSAAAIIELYTRS